MRKFLVAVAIVISASAFAQDVVDRSKDRANTKVNNRVDNRVDQGIDKGLNAIEGLFKKKNKSNSSEADQVEQTGSVKIDQDVSIQDSYHFDHQVDMKIMSYNKKGKAEEPVMYTMLTAEDQNLIGTLMAFEGVSSKAIVDIDNQIMVTLTDQPGMKIGMKMKFDSDKFQEENNEPTSLPKATGASKVISGYTCYEYVKTDDEGTYQFWVTEEEKINWLSGYAISSKDASAAQGEMFSGMIMEMTMTDKKGAKTVMTVTEVRKNQALDIETAGYTFMNLFGNN